MGTIIVLTIIAAWIILALRSVFGKKKGCSGCKKSCSSCPSRTLDIDKIERRLLADSSSNR